MIKKLYSFLCSFAVNIWWPAWSNFRWKDSIRYNFPIKLGEKFTSLEGLQQILNKIYSVFNYTKDPADQLWDSIVPPPENYLNYTKGNISDDCDGFHATVYHIVANNNVVCYLMSVNAIGSGHCVLILCYQNKWHVVDYRSIYDGYDTAEEAIEKYNKIYSTKYKAKEVVFNGFIEYDYKEEKFKSVPLLK